jgi:HlyD family secretion protein
MAAQVATAEALVKESQAGVKRAEANHERWSAEAERLTKLANDKVVDVQTRDETINQARAAAAALDEVQARILTSIAMRKRWQAELAKAKVDTLADEARLAVARADADRVKALQTYKEIRAPFDGVVTRRSIDPGHLIQPGKPEVLLVIASTGKVRVAIDIPEADAALVHKGDTASVRIPSLGGPALTATVSRLAWSLDSHARTLRAEIDVPNKDDRLRPGMYVIARVAVDVPAVRAVPARALLRAGETQACFVVRDGKAVRVRVKAGRSDGEWTEIVEKQGADGTWAPFHDDEPVIVSPPASLADGQAVQVAK